MYVVHMYNLFPPIFSLEFVEALVHNFACAITNKNMYAYIYRYIYVYVCICMYICECVYTMYM